MKNEWLIKILALGIVVLFIGVGFQSVLGDYNKMFSGISTSISKNTNEISIKVILSSDKFGQIKRYTLKLSNHQLEELNDIFDNLKIELYKCKSDTEVIKVYKDTIVSLGEKDLLPNEISVKKAQNLVIRKNNFQLRNINYSINQINEEDLINKRCYITGKTTQTSTWPFSDSGGLLKFLVNWLLSIFKIRPGIYTTLTFGSYHEFSSDGGPANGWIYTKGLNGTKTRNTSFYGQIDRVGYGQTGDIYFVGANGFTGLIYEGNETIPSYYIGYTKMIHIGSVEP